MMRSVSGWMAVLLVLGACELPAHPSATLEVRVTGKGTTTPAPGTHVFTAGHGVQVEAAADPDWAFQGWTGDGAGQAHAETGAA